jgi:hypothetical protein
VRIQEKERIKDEYHREARDEVNALLSKTLSLGVCIHEIVARTV